MNKIIILFCFVANMLPIAIGTAFAQNSNFRRDCLYQLLKQAETPAKQVAAWAGNQIRLAVAKKTIEELEKNNHLNFPETV